MLLRRWTILLKQNTNWMLSFETNPLPGSTASSFWTPESYQRHVQRAKEYPSHSSTLLIRRILASNSSCWKLHSKLTMTSNSRTPRACWHTGVSQSPWEWSKHTNQVKKQNTSKIPQPGHLLHLHGQGNMNTNRLREISMWERNTYDMLHLVCWPKWEKNTIPK